VTLPNIHLLGIQGSGKGTQAALLVEAYAATYLASGNLFRQRASIDDEFGRAIATMMHAGQLLPNRYLLETVRQFLGEHQVHSFLLGDGIIRTLAQLHELVPIWQNFNLEAPLLINLDLSEDVARERVTKREQERDLAEKHDYHAVYSGKLIHRTDDNPQALEERFRLFRRMTEPIIAQFVAQGRCVTISADQSVESIQVHIRAGIASFYPQLSL
jgi:adenylate kinase